MTVPVIELWTPQMYGYVPGLVKRCVYAAGAVCGPNFGPASASESICTAWSKSSRFVHVTVPPVFTRTAFGPKVKSCTMTFATAGGGAGGAPPGARATRG